jgi:DNA-binding GntR family transcriptional regulator
MTLPRYQEIADELLAEIGGGRFSVGSMLPTEIDLCERFGVSRFTVREALRQLHEKGILTRRRGSGTVVQNLHPNTAYVRSIGTLDELLQYPPEMRLIVMGRDEIQADAEQAKLLECRINRKWLRFSGVRSIEPEGYRISWTEIYVIPKYRGVSKSIGVDPRPAYEQIVDRYKENIQNVKVEIFATRISKAIAKPLGVEVDSPGMTIIRRYYGKDGKMFEVSISTHPEGRYTYALELTRET